MPSKELRKIARTEDAVETMGGLAGLIAYVNDVASDADRRQLRDQVGFALNAIGHELRRARKGLAHLRRDVCRRCRDDAANGP